MAVVDLTESLQLGISSDFADYYRKEMISYEETRGAITRVIPTNKRTVEEVIKESIPFPKLWPLGMPRSFQTLQDRVVTLEHRNWELGIPWSRWDEEDEIPKDLQTHLQQMAGRFSQVVDQLMADELQQSATLGQTLGTAHDGAALFSTTDGAGANRLGVSGGNILTIGGVETEADIFKALYSAKTRLLNMQDTEGQPFWLDSEVDFPNMLVIHGPALTEVMDRARRAEFAWAQKGIPQASSNTLQGRFRTWVNQRITSSTEFYIAVIHPFYKPFVLVDRRMGPEIQVENEMNSDRSRSVGERRIMGHTRLGVAPFAPHAILEMQVA